MTTMCWADYTEPESNVIRFPTSDEQALRASIYLDNELKPFDVRTRCEARARASRLVESGVLPYEAARRVLKWARCRIAPTSDDAA